MCPCKTWHRTSTVYPPLLQAFAVEGARLGHHRVRELDRLRDETAREGIEEGSRRPDGEQAAGENPALDPLAVHILRSGLCEHTLFTPLVARELSHPRAAETALCHTHKEKSFSGQYRQSFS